MKRVYRSESPAMAWHMRNVLEQYGIDAVVKNENLFSVAGEVPFTECLSEVWVVRSLDHQRAERIIQELNNEEITAEPDWICASCGEDNVGSFAVCWNCENSHD